MLLERYVVDGDIQYACWEHETAPTTGTKHIQGYLYYKSAVGLNRVKQLIPSAHLEGAKGSAAQNRTYCHKDPKAQHFEFGTMPSQGRRTDVETIKTIVREGGQMDKVIEASTSYQSMRMGELLLKYAKPPVREPPRVLWFWGETGAGKTRTAVEMGGDDFWISGRDLKWWDGYTGQKTVIIDDFRTDFCTMHELLRIVDRYPYRVQVKGGSTWLAATTIIFTSPHEPSFTFRDRWDEHSAQILRRITEIREFHAPGVGAGAAPPPAPPSSPPVGPRCTEVIAQKSGGNTILPTSTHRYIRPQTQSLIDQAKRCLEDSHT